VTQLLEQLANKMETKTRIERNRFIILSNDGQV